jgi:hypothetical protein
MQIRIIDKTWQIMGLWWTRIEVRSARIHNTNPAQPLAEPTARRRVVE